MKSSGRQALFAVTLHTMAISVKNKIRLGTIFLFLLVVLSGGFSIYYLFSLKQQTQNIIKANYESLQYAHRMQAALDGIQAGNNAYLDSFNKQLKLQEGNITEQGEKEATQMLRGLLGRLANDDTAVGQTRFWLLHILTLNMEAIRLKSEASEASTKKVTTYLITIILVIFLVGFTFVVNFPSVITSPIRKLAEAIKEISQKNYRHRVHIESKDEFGDLANAFNDMAERLEYFETSNLNKLIFEKSRAEAVINSLKDASIGIDKADVVLFANNQALSLLGLSAKDIVGQKTGAVAARNDLFRFLLDEKGGTPFKIVVDNKENYFTKEVVDVESGGNKVIVLKNITSFKELDVAKTNFIATVSHELKTPLASSDFSLKLLEDERIGPLSGEQKELIQNLKGDNQRMLRILSELLNLSQVEAGKIQLNIRPLNPAQVVEHSLQAVATSAREKGIRISKEADERLPAIEGDSDKIIWVLNNFLTNAIKYSPGDSHVLVSVKAAGSKVSFSVADKGNGIEAKYLDRIFERYYQVPGRSDAKGSGIGLAICKEFIEAMGGKIWVKSNYGEGSTFGFDLG